MGEAALVTGGGGFIGTWVLRELLARGVRPIALDRSVQPERWQRILKDRANDVVYVESDLLDVARLTAICREHQVTRLIHLAALLTPACQADPWLGCQVNVMGSVALFEVARALAGQIRGISYASSYAVYGPEADDGSHSGDTTENRPPTFYGAFKLAVDLIAEQYWRHFQIASVGIRPHVVYGPERVQGLTAGPSLATRAAVEGRDFTIGYTGRAGYDYVEDVALAFVRAAWETPAGSHIVDLPGEVASTEEFAAAIRAAVPNSSAQLTVNGPPIPSNIPPHPHWISHLYPDWRATSLAEGVRRTAAFYQPS